MSGHRLEHTTEQGADFQRFVIRHSDMMDAVQVRTQADMGTILPAAFIAEHAEGLGQISARDLARDSHTANISSRT